MGPILQTVSEQSKIGKGFQGQIDEINNKIAAQSKESSLFKQTLKQFEDLSKNLIKVEQEVK